MASITYLTAFNNLILKFNNDLIDTFPKKMILKCINVVLNCYSKRMQKNLVYFSKIM